MTLNVFVRSSRAECTRSDKSVRSLFHTELIEKTSNAELYKYLADKIPSFYRSIEKFKSDLDDGYNLTPLYEALAKLPNSRSFQESHLGEILMSLFAEEILGWKVLYKKLTQLSAQNSNAYKIDLVLYDPLREPIEFIFGEVKMSTKTSKDGLPSNHHKSIYADLFDSMSKYGESDKEFDLTAAKDNVDQAPKGDQERLKKALLPYGERIVKYFGFIMIDHSTFNTDEYRILQNRKNDKYFDIDLITVEVLPDIITKVFNKLNTVKAALCS